MMRWILLFAVGALLLMLPFADAPMANSWLFRVSTLVILTISWNMMANAGLVSLGHAAFWGIGSYVGILTANWTGMPFFVALGPAMIGGALLGVVLAIGTARLRGIYFAMSTLALSEGLRVVALMVPSVTGGASGIYIDKHATPSAVLLPLFALLGAYVSIALSVYLIRTRFHFASRALRNSEDAAKMLGIDPRRYRVNVMALSGALAAAAGCLNAAYSGYLDPETAFSLNYTILPQISAIIGGVHTVAGPVLGGIFIMVLMEVTRFASGATPGIGLMILGILLVVCILYLPRGIHGMITSLVLRRVPARRKEQERSEKASAAS